MDELLERLRWMLNLPVTATVSFNDRLGGACLAIWRVMQSRASFSMRAFSSAE